MVSGNHMAEAEAEAEAEQGLGSSVIVITKCLKRK
jgi:hypothetical protein